MSRIGVLLATSALVLAVPSLAHAEDVHPREDFDPDSHLAIEIRFGAYRPNVDSQPGLSGSPYQETFGDSRRFMIGAEVDYQLLHLSHVGSLAVGGWIGFTRSSAPAIFVTGPNAGQPSQAEDTTLAVTPMGVLLSARIDALARETAIPLVPYGKFGLGTALWSSSNGLGASRDPNTGQIGRGHTNGLTYAVGLMFMMDALDRQTAKTFSVEIGVHHTYLFAEWTVTAFDGLFQTNAMYVGDSTWNAGFAFEM